MVLRMASPTKSANGVYYYIVRVPVDLIGIVGRDRIKESLQTKDPSEAKLRFAERHSQSLREWEGLKSSPITLTHKQTIALSGDRYQFWVDQFGDDPSAPEEYANLIDMMRGVEHDPERLKVWYGPSLDKIMLDEGLKLDDATRLALMRQIHSVDIQAANTLFRNSKGDYSPDPQANRFPAWSEVKPSAATKKATIKVTFEDLFHLWKRDHLAEGKSEETVRDFRHKVEALIAYLGHNDALTITPLNVSDWCDHLRHDTKLKARTVRDKYLAAIKAVYRVGIAKQRIDFDPTKGVTVKVAKRPILRSKGFTDGEANTILIAARRDPDELGGAAIGNKNAIRWVPWICAFSGARAGEITQLRKEDFSKEHGIDFLRITPEAGSVKSRNYRIVPIHPQLLELGLLEFVESAPEGYLFFTLGVNDDPKKRADSVYTKVGAWVRKGARVDDPLVQPNHAWRHRFKSLCREYDISEEYSDAITGHEDGRAAASYGGYSVKALFREIQKLPKYPL